MTLPNRASGNGENSVEESVVLVVPPSANAPQLFRFVYQLDESFRGNHASIRNIVPSWDSGTVITVQMQPEKLFSFLRNLGNMPEVEKVEEEPLGRDGFSSFPKRFGALPKLGTSPGKRVHLTLKEIDTA